MAQRVDDARSSTPGNRGGTAPRAELTERSRDRILAAALAEFANRGFDGTTTAEIARRAGVTQPLVHYHFDSKDALWYATVEAAFQSAAGSFADVGRELADLDIVDQMKVLVRRYVRFSATNPELARIISYEGVLGGPRLTWLSEHHLTSRFDLFGHLFEAGVGNGRLKDLPTQHVLTSISAAGAYLFIIRAAMLEVHDIDVTDPAVVEAHADTVVELFFHGLVREGAPT